MLKIKGANLVAQFPPMFNVKANSISCSTFERVKDKDTKMTSRQPVTLMLNLVVICMVFIYHKFSIF